MFWAVVPLEIISQRMFLYNLRRQIFDFFVQTLTFKLCHITTVIKFQYFLIKHHKENRNQPKHQTMISARIIIGILLASSSTAASWPFQSRELSTHDSCSDNDAYRSPIAPNLGCELHNMTNCDCNTFEHLMTQQELQELFTSCPLTCGVPCDYQLNAPSASPTNSMIPSTVPSAEPSDCNDDETYSSPINTNLGCELYGNTGCDCYAFQDYMTTEELQELFTRCPQTCEVTCDFKLPAPPSMNPSKSMIPTASPTEDDGSGGITFSPTEAPAPRRSTPTNAPSHTPSVSMIPTASPTKDDGSGGITFSPTEAPNPRSITIQPSAVPSQKPTKTSNDCVDDESYISPIAPDFGCDLYANLDCNFFQNEMTEQQMQELLASCPETCGVVSCEIQPSEIPSEKPSISTQPSAIPSQKPSHRPSFTPSNLPTFIPSNHPSTLPNRVPSQSPSVSPTKTSNDCVDDESYISPIAPDFGCELYANLDCNHFQSSMTEQQMQELLASCPETCGVVSCEIQPSEIPSEKPSISTQPSAIPSQKPTKTSNDCVDDESYISPIAPNFGCELYANLDCNFFQSNMTEQQMQELLASCPETCGVVSCEITSRPSSSVSRSVLPSMLPSRVPTQNPSDKPSSHPSMKPSTASSHLPSYEPSGTPTDFPTENPSQSSQPTSGPSDKPSRSPSDAPSLSKSPSLAPSVSGSPSSLPSATPTNQPSNCPSNVEGCLAHVCVTNENTNIALAGLGNSNTCSERGNVQGPIDGNTLTQFSGVIPYGSTYESTADNEYHWWEVDLQGVFDIAQVKIFACVGVSCHPEGKKLDQIQVDIYDGLVITFSSSFFLDQAPVFDLILPFEIQGQIVRITQMQTGNVLSLSEVQVFGH